ncbi:hypothetical protein ABW19_dt0207699 [Dactylella cylindrospora]|nr:hypothetical protein ABW19_dt0207699 [Dactylella cylindrospora]
MKIPYYALVGLVIGIPNIQASPINRNLAVTDGQPSYAAPPLPREPHQESEIKSDVAYGEGFNELDGTYTGDAESTEKSSQRIHPRGLLGFGITDKVRGVIQNGKSAINQGIDRSRYGRYGSYSSSSRSSDREWLSSSYNQQDRPKAPPPPPPYPPPPNVPGPWNPRPHLNGENDSPSPVIPVNAKAGPPPLPARNKPTPPPLPARNKPTPLNKPTPRPAPTRSKPVAPPVPPRHDGWSPTGPSQSHNLGNTQGSGFSPNTFNPNARTQNYGTSSGSSRTDGYEDPFRDPSQPNTPSYRADDRSSSDWRGGISTGSRTADNFMDSLVRNGRGGYSRPENYRVPPDPREPGFINPNTAINEAVGAGVKAAGKQLLGSYLKSKGF